MKLFYMEYYWRPNLSPAVNFGIWLREQQRLRNHLYAEVLKGAGLTTIK